MNTLVIFCIGMSVKNFGFQVSKNYSQNMLKMNFLTCHSRSTTINQLDSRFQNTLHREELYYQHMLKISEKISICIDSNKTISFQSFIDYFSIYISKIIGKLTPYSGSIRTSKVNCNINIAYRFTREHSKHR